MSGCTCCSTKSLEMKVKYHNKDISKIEKIEQGDWLDLRAAEDVTLGFMEHAYISLGISVQVPEGYEMWIVPRSSTYKKFGIIQANHKGIIDESYCGDNDVVKMSAIALRPTSISTGDRICQFRLCKKQKDINIVEVESLNNPDRGGFGSTGVR